MSKRKWGGPTGVQRVCAQCGHGISEERPVFLVGLEDGRIVGPYHAGCAEKVVLHKKKYMTPGHVEQAEMFGTYPLRREETTPW